MLGSSGIKGGAPKDSCRERELTILARSNRVNCGIPIVTFLDSGFFVTFLDSGFFVTFLDFDSVFTLDLLDNKNQIWQAIIMVQLSITQGFNR